MNGPRCRRCGEFVAVCIALPTTINFTAEGVATIATDTTDADDVTTDDLLCECDDGPDLTDEEVSGLREVLGWLGAHYAPAVDASLPEMAQMVHDNERRDTMDADGVDQ